MAARADSPPRSLRDSYLPSLVPGESRDAWRRPSVISLGVLLVIAPQLLGGAFPWAIACTALFATGVCALAARDARGSLPLIALLLLTLLAWTALQALPLPGALVELLAPQSAALWQANALAQSQARRAWFALSFDPGGTRLEVAKGAAICAAFVAALCVRKIYSRRIVLKLVAFSVIAMAFVALGHEMFRAEEVFGVYRPTQAYSRLLAPLMNENHLGGFMVLGGALSLAFGLEQHSRQRAALWLGATCLIALCSMLSMSRGAIIALLGSFPGIVVIRLIQKRKQKVHAPRRAVLMLVLLVTAFVCFFSFRSSELETEFSQRHNITSKIELANKTLPILSANPLLGVGRGAFSVAAAQRFGTERRAHYPENILIQWSTEWGVPFALLLFVGCAFALIRGARKSRSLAFAGAAAGLIALVVQNLVDFSLEMSGVAVVAGALLAALVDVRPSRFGFQNACRGISLVAFVGAALAINMHGHDLSTLEREVRIAFQQGDVQRLDELAIDNLTLHPGEPVLMLARAYASVHNNEASAPRWINRAQTLAPGWDAPHLVAARWLLRRAKNHQAMLEIRVAEELRKKSAHQLSCELAEQGLSVDLLARAAPQNPQGAGFLDRISRCVRDEQPELVAELDRRALLLDASAEGPALRTAGRIARAKGPLEAISFLEQLPERKPAFIHALVSFYLKLGRKRDALTLLTPLSQKATPSTDTLRQMFRLQVALGSDAEANHWATRLRGRLAANAQSLAQAEFYFGSVYAEYGRRAEALRAYDYSLKLHPNGEALRAIKRLAEQSGQPARALQAQRKLCSLGFGSTEQCD